MWPVCIFIYVPLQPAVLVWKQLKKQNLEVMSCEKWPIKIVSFQSPQSTSEKWITQKDERSSFVGAS